MDPPAPGVKETISRLREAGLRTIMLTGDQRLTAEAIGRELGILRGDEEVIDGREIDRLSPAELQERVATAGAFSRVSPEHKLKLVLQDDRFETIAAAVEEGRVIYDNIRKFVFYLFSCNVAEVFVLLFAGLAGLPPPLLPLQILWLNILTDTFPEAGYRTAFWGKVPGTPLTAPGGDPQRIARISEDYLELLPGRGRLLLSNVLRRKWSRRPRGRA